MRPPKAAPDGTMALVDHLRELRYRVIVSVLGVVLGGAVCAIFYTHVLAVALHPFERAAAAYRAADPTAKVNLSLNSVTDPFSLVIWIMVVAGLILSCPVWLYQLWAFIAPALLKNEKKIALIFIGSATPLFLGGVTLGYFVLPKGIEVLLGFTPSGFGVVNLLEMRKFLEFELVMLLVFGLSFLLPVVLISLNVVGVVRGYQLGKARKGVIFGTVVFAAVATPSTDPFSLLALATPMTVLYFLSEIICRANDKRRGVTPESIAEFQIDVDKDT